MDRPSYCSFCGRSSDDVGPMLAKTDTLPDNRRHVYICRPCAAEAIEIIDQQIQQRSESLDPRGWTAGVVPELNDLAAMEDQQSQQQQW